VQVVLKYLLASDAASEAILPVLASVLQFSHSEVEHLLAARSSVVGEATSYITTAIFGASPEPRLSLAPRQAMFDVDARLASPGDFDGRRNASRPVDSAATPGEVEELKRKVARLKQLLSIANAHLSRFHKQSASSSSPIINAPNGAEGMVI
jgi:hypothetical protein